MNDIEMLNTICENAEMGRDGISHLAAMSSDAAFKGLLETQQNEYQKNYDDASKLLGKLGQVPKHANRVAKASSFIGSKVRTLTDTSPSKLAELMIEGSTMGITKLTKEFNQYGGDQQEIKDLALRHLLAEQTNIDQMKQYL